MKKRTRNPHAGALRHYKPKREGDKREKLRLRFAKKEEEDADDAGR